MQNGVEPRHTAASLKQYQQLSLDSKIRLSELRIRQWYDSHDGAVYVAFSGGLDSTVVGHLVRRLFPEVPLVFHDSPLEFPENRAFAKSQGAIFTKPTKTPFQVFMIHGYPVVSKEVSKKLGEAIRFPGCYRRYVEGLKKDGTPISGRTIPAKWRFLLDAPFPISHKCCDIFKKGPARRYEKESGRVPFLGVRADESELRSAEWKRAGCNSFKNKRHRSWPIAFWSHQDVLDYIRITGCPYSKAYDKGYVRTGCMFCMFGVDRDGTPNRFQRLSVTHPAIWKYCMDKLGIRSVMEYLGYPVDYKGMFF